MKYAEAIANANRAWMVRAEAIAAAEADFQVALDALHMAAIDALKAAGIEDGATFVAQRRYERKPSTLSLHFTAFSGERWGKIMPRFLCPYLTSKGVVHGGKNAAEYTVEELLDPEKVRFIPREVTV